MNLEFTVEEQAFRAEVRGFIERHYSERLKTASTQREMSREKALGWHKILGEKGWSVPAWPVEYGGPGWTATQRYIWREENARAGTEPLLPFGVDMVGPILYTFGTEAQKQRFLPGIRSGDDWWCQGFSESNAGSDLASLKTRAFRYGDHYVVNGQKTWTSHAQFADWGFFLVRTDVEAKKPQEGISFLLIDMKTPGVTVRPILMIDGGYEVNDVFLDNVRAPAVNLVGAENNGWTYAKFLLVHERAGIASVARSKQAVALLRSLARAEFAGDGGPLILDDSFQTKIAELEIDLLALEYTELRTLAREQAGESPGPESSLLKIAGTEIQQRITELTLEAVGHYAAPDAPFPPSADDNAIPVGSRHAHAAAHDYFNMRKVSLYGGSNEIQRNIIAKMALGL